MNDQSISSLAVFEIIAFCVGVAAVLHDTFTR